MTTSIERTLTDESLQESPQNPLSGAGRAGAPSVLTSLRSEQIGTIDNQGSQPLSRAAHLL